MNAATQPVLIVLAAWSGERWLEDRQGPTRALGPQAVLTATLAHALASEMPVLLVTTPALGELARGTLAMRDIVVVPPLPAQGLNEGYSIAMGVAARPHAAGWVVLPGDMPLVRPTTIQAVARGLSHYPVTYPQHEGRDGHPTGFSSELYSELIHLHSDEGPRRLRSRYPAHGVEVLDPGVLIDIDEIDDFDMLRQCYGLPDALDLQWASDGGGPPLAA